MALPTELTDILRVLVNDADSTSYTDAILEKTLAVAARQVTVEMDFTQDFKITIGTTPAIAPDPTDDAGGTRDDSFINLATLKAACIMDQGAALLAAKQAIAVGDGSSKIDLRERAAWLLKLLEKGWCAAFENAKLEYKSGQVQVAGAAVMTPFRLYAAGMFGGRDVRSVMNY